MFEEVGIGDTTGGGRFEENGMGDTGDADDCKMELVNIESGG